MSSKLPNEVPLSRVPSAVPPPGLSSNFVNPPTLHPAIVAVCSVMTSLTLFFVLIRLHLHLHSGHKFGLDDCMMPFILILTGGNQFAELQADFCDAATILTFGYTGITLSRKLSSQHRTRRRPPHRAVLTFFSNHDVSPPVGFTLELVRCCVSQGLYRLIH